MAADSVLEQDWIFDSGASFHVTSCREWFDTYTEVLDASVMLGNRSICKIAGMGNIHTAFENGQKFVLKDVRHVPKVKKNLISVGQLDDAGYHVTFGNQAWKLLRGSLVVAKGSKFRTLYPMHVSHMQESVVAVSEQPSAELWHRRMGHISAKGIKVLSSLQYLRVFDYSEFPFCEHCVYGKQVKSSYKRTRTALKVDILQLVHSDVCGPMPTKSLGGAEYFLTFVDDASRKVWAYPLRHKEQVITKFKQWVALVENKTQKKVICLRSDNGGEYKSRDFQSSCEEKGIKREWTAPYNPSSNGVAERMNRIIQERV